MLKRNWVPIALALFAIADLVLVYLAINHSSGSAASVTSTAPVSTAPAETTEPAMPSAEPTATPTVDPAAVGLASLSSDGAVMRATAGSCTTGAAPTLDVSTDDGATFTAVLTPAKEILRVIARSAGSFQYVGADENCEVSLYESADGGETWTEGSAEGTWYVQPGGVGVVSPQGPVEVGCQVISLSAVSQNAAAVVCSDGTSRVTANSGAAWSSGGNSRAIVSVSFLDQVNGYALAVGPDCPAEIQRTVDGGTTWLPVGCIQGTTPHAIDAIGEKVFATVDGEAHESTDGGKTWN